MLKYSKLIIFILVLVVVSATIVFIDSSMDNINDSMPEVSDNIVQGDKDYNEAVDLVNNKYFHDGLDKASSAEEHYNKSLNSLSKIKKNLTVDIDDVQKDYINLVFDEVEMKLNATTKFKEAIKFFQNNENATGSDYASEANENMYVAVDYRNSSDTLIRKNPNLFKENFIFN